MTRFTKALAASLLVAGAALAACDESATDINPCVPFEGAWTATTFTYTSNADPTVVVNALSFGASISLTVDDQCTYTGTAVIPPSTDPLSLSGSFTLSDGTLTLTENNVPSLSQIFDYTLNGDVLSLVNEDSAFDFNQDGTITLPDESATLTLVLER